MCIIDRDSPQEVLQGLAELTGTIKLPVRWTLGYHQSRISYDSEKRVMEIANYFKNLSVNIILDFFHYNSFESITLKRFKPSKL